MTGGICFCPKYTIRRSAAGANLRESPGKQREKSGSGTVSGTLSLFVELCGKVCYTGGAALLHSGNRREVSHRMIQVLIDFIVAVAAQITACYLCSDSHEEVGWNIPLYPRTKKRPLGVAAPRGRFCIYLRAKALFHTSMTRHLGTRPSGAKVPSLRAVSRWASSPRVAGMAAPSGSRFFSMTRVVTS